MREEQGKSWITIIAFFLCSMNLNAQEITIKGGFIEDSLLIGQDVNYWLSANYPPDLEMVFPDSLYNFKPFEFSSKTYFETQLVDGQAYDSAVYTVQSFEIDPVQYLNLRAIILKRNDSTIVESALDSVYLKELVPVVTDSTKLKTNLDYQIVDTQFNFPLLYYILGGIGILIVILLVIFGKRILRWFKLRKLRIQYEHFSDAFDQYIKKLMVDPVPEYAEKALAFWKDYQQRLDKIPFTVLTSKEILNLEFTSELEKPLKAIDRVVYGKRTDESIFQDFQQLDTFAQDRYERKVEEIKNGK